MNRGRACNGKLLLTGGGSRIDGCRRRSPTIRPALLPRRFHEEPRVKTYDIEVQRLKSIKHDKGQFALAIDALVLARPARDEDETPTCLLLPVEHARTLLILLKQQLGELDKLQPRSRRSGRC